jgi:hypothetical protein
MNTDEPVPQLPLSIEALECLSPDLINVLTALADLGELEIEDFICRAMWEELERNGDLDRYRKEHGLPEDWPFDEEERNT